MILFELLCRIMIFHSWEGQSQKILAICVGLCLELIINTKYCLLLTISSYQFGGLFYWFFCRAPLFPLVRILKLTPWND